MATFDQVIDAVMRYRDVTRADLIGKDRSHPICRYRLELCFLLREHTDMSFPEIGRAIGGRDHTTIKSACRSVRKRMSENPELVADIEKMRTLIRAAGFVVRHPRENDSAPEIAREIVQNMMPATAMTTEDLWIMARWILEAEATNELALAIVRTHSQEERSHA